MCLYDGQIYEQIPTTMSFEIAGEPICPFCLMNNVKDEDEILHKLHQFELPCSVLYWNIQLSIHAWKEKNYISNTVTYYKVPSDFWSIFSNTGNLQHCAEKSTLDDYMQVDFPGGMCTCWALSLKAAVVMSLAGPGTSPCGVQLWLYTTARKCTTMVYWLVFSQQLCWLH